MLKKISTLFENVGKIIKLKKNTLNYVKIIIGQRFVAKKNIN